MLRWTQVVIYHLPSPTFTPSFLLSRSLPLVLQMSQSFFLIPPLPLLSSRVKRHYIIMPAWIIVMVVCETRERLGELWLAGVEMPDKRESGFCASINEEYLGLISKKVRITCLFFLLYGVKLTFIFVKEVKGAQYNVCVSRVALEYTVLLKLIHRGFSRNICVVTNVTFHLHFACPRPNLLCKGRKSVLFLLSVLLMLYIICYYLFHILFELIFMSCNY